MAIVSAKANGCCVFYVCAALHVCVFYTVLCMLVHAIVRFFLSQNQLIPECVDEFKCRKELKQATRKKFGPLYIFQFIHNSVLLNVPIM